MRRIVMAAVMLTLSAPLSAQDKGADVLKQMRKALGDKIETVNTLTLEGPFQREMGPRQMTGTIVLNLALPASLHRSEEMELPGGMSVERLVATNGTVAWDDQKQRGGMGGGMQIIMAGPGGRDLNPEAIEEARLRRTRNELNRYLLAFLGAATLQPTWVATAEAPEGKADVLEVKNEQGATIRLFVDQQTHMPLMLQYMEVRPRINMMGGPGGPGGPGGGRRGPGGPDGPPPPPPPDGAPAAGAPAGGAPADGQRPSPEEVRRRMESMPPPAPSQMTLYLADFKKVDGIMLPHRLTQAADGKPVEEWTLEKVKVNPSVKADLFDKK
jgi:hypothetical protein